MSCEAIPLQQPRHLQLLLVCEDPVLRAELVTRVGPCEHSPVILGPEDRASTQWQTQRACSAAWAVVAAGRTVEERAEWVQLVSLAFRPTRLVALLPAYDLEATLRLVRAGADGVLPGRVTAAQVLEELEGDGVRGEEIFPDPAQWLNTLRRAGEQLLLSDDPTLQLQKLLRLCVSRLKMDRASVMMREDEGVRVVAGIGLPARIRVDEAFTPSPHSVTAWVLEHRRPRLVEGNYSHTPHETQVRAAISVPLIAGGELLGVVNFSSLSSGRRLTPADLAAAEVLAGMIALSISNHRLMLENMESARLAAVGRTTATISHCMKNILQLFKGSQMLLRQASEKSGDGEAGELATGMLGRATRRLENLVMDLLDFSRARQPQRVPMAPRQLLRDVLEVFEGSGGGASHCFEVDCAIEEEVELDATRLQRALINLVSNSVDVLDKGGHVRLEAFRRDGRIVFAVSDDGPGVLDEHLSAIFEPFYSTKGSKGTGLGLAMVRKFCEENGGRALAMRCEALGGLRIEMELAVGEE